MHRMQLHAQGSRTLVGISNYTCSRSTLDIHKRILNLVGNNPSLPWVWQHHAFSKMKTNVHTQNLACFFFEAFLSPKQHRFLATDQQPGQLQKPEIPGNQHILQAKNYCQGTTGGCLKYGVIKCTATKLGNSTAGGCFSWL